MGKFKIESTEFKIQLLQLFKSFERVWENFFKSFPTKKGVRLWNVMRSE